MPITKRKSSYLLNLERRLQGLSRKQRTQAKNEIRDYVLSEIESHTQAQTSPVDGSRFAELSSAYRKVKRALGKGGDADLHLNNDMINSLHAVNKENGVEFRITDSLEKLKSFNHNTGDTVPRRQFLPDDQRRGKFGTFNSDIRDGINSIIRRVRESEESS